MRLLSPSTVLAAALASAGIVIPFLPESHTTTSAFFLEARLASSADGIVQVYYDSGKGYYEGDSSTVPLHKNKNPQLYRLGLPAGIYPTFRFDPIDRDGTVTIASARVVNRKGELIRDITLGEFRPVHQIAAMQIKESGLEVVTTPGADDPQLQLRFDPPLALSNPWLGLALKWLPHWLLSAAGVFVLLLLALVGIERAPRLRQVAGSGLRWITANPNRALAAAAAAAVIASAYPIVFLGKSYVSPNLGTVLLYDEYPTLPGSKESRTAEVKGSDIGAIMWEFVPFSMVQHRSLFRDHELPVWDRYNSGGTPLLGQGFSMFGDPLHFIPVIADGAAWAWDIKYLVAKWLFSFGLGLIVFAVTRHLPSAAIVALAAPFVGFFIYRVNHPAIFSLCYAPWCLYCWLRVSQTVRPRGAAGWTLGLILANFALINTGTAKEAYVLLLTLNFSGACVLIASGAPWRQRLFKLGGMVWAGILFVLFASPVWFIFAETLRTAYTSYNSPLAFQIRPEVILGAFDEAFYRPLNRFHMVFNPSANFLILAGLLYFLATLRVHFTQRATVALALSSLVPLAFAFGLVPSALIVKIPFLANIAHIDNSFTCSLIILWAVLAGVGFSTAARRLGSPEGRDDLIIAGLLLFVPVFSFIAFRQVVHRDVFSADTTYMPLKLNESVPVGVFIWCYLAVLLAAVIGLGLMARGALIRRRLSAASAIGLALCTIALLWRQGAQAEAVGFEDYVFHPTSRPHFHAQSGAIRFVQKSQDAEPSRAVGLQSNFFPGWNGVYGLEAIGGPEPLVNPLYREFTGLSPLTRIWDWRLYLTRDNLAASRPILDFLNVRYYFDLRSDQGALGAVLKLDRTGDLDVYESRTAWPRAFFTDRIGVYRSPAQLVHQIERGDGRPFAAARAADVAGDPFLSGFSHDLAGRTVEPADHYRLTENTTSFQIQAPGPGVAVLSEVWWPGYPHAQLDGHPVHLLRLNDFFEGVAIASGGLHQVRISYRPPYFNLTLALSGAALILMAGSFWAVARFEKRSTLGG